MDATRLAGRRLFRYKVTFTCGPTTRLPPPGIACPACRPLRDAPGEGEIRTYPRPRGFFVNPCAAGRRPIGSVRATRLPDLARTWPGQLRPDRDDVPALPGRFKVS